MYWRVIENDDDASLVLSPKKKVFVVRRGWRIARVKSCLSPNPSSLLILSPLEDAGKEVPTVGGRGWAGSLLCAIVIMIMLYDDGCWRGRSI
jgi:hypothetical protein